jgi:hypothetical protein
MLTASLQTPGLADSRDDFVNALSKYFDREKVVAMYGTASAAVRDEAKAAVSPLVITTLVVSGIAGALGALALIVAVKAKKGS